MCLANLGMLGPKARPQTGERGLELGQRPVRLPQPVQRHSNVAVDERNLKMCIPVRGFGDRQRLSMLAQGALVVRELIQGQADVGANADWRECTANENTCKSRENVNASRIDGILANLEALQIIRKVHVEKDTNIPTHSAVGLVVSRNAIERE